MQLLCGAFKLDLSCPKVMGIVNVTPDSFSDGGRYVSFSNAIDHARQLLEDGADMLDIGGESTRPGAAEVGEQEELDRVLPVIEGLRGITVPISIDTWKPAVMRAAIKAGATMVNDVNALQAEGAIQAVAASDAAVCLMHKQGTPQSMQQHPSYDDVVLEVADFMRQRIAAVAAAGVGRDRIVIDPGFGFGKSLAHNLALLRELEAFTKLGMPVLAGLSRKSMLGAITGREVGERLAASVAAAVLAVQRGAAIVRVHDVRETVDALKILNAVNGDRYE
ncbi:MAG: dihydropteroate synthase [Gammaproteobacteria bacterium]|nr:dihydropteroate synthase [Sideroxydans sp.]MBU4045041.1 dihydropteroate synthase [Gammaproteobacteria bacterium]MBU4150932.1 dihydropteroate synthase [Gammaproteobacteria bacterium]